MPYLLTRTNASISQEGQQKLLARGSELVANALGKPERYVMVSLECNVPMMFDGKDAPCAYLELKSIGLPGDHTAALSQSLCGLINEELDIPTDRIYIEFADAPRHMWGWNGSTF
jgi:phenylpyruvate tautomerase